MVGRKLFIVYCILSVRCIESHIMLLKADPSFLFSHFCLIYIFPLFLYLLSSFKRISAFYQARLTNRYVGNTVEHVLVKHRFLKNIVFPLPNFSLFLLKNYSFVEHLRRVNTVSLKRLPLFTNKKS